MLNETPDVYQTPATPPRDQNDVIAEESQSKSSSAALSVNYTANAMGKNSPGQSANTLIPSVLMLTKHSNGSLNLWQISFAESSKFSTVLSVAHASRACGHRFHTNSATCHPVPPLLLTTSHHNTPTHPRDVRKVGDLRQGSDGRGSCGFVSELILWRVDPVGPLSKSGGISELARVDSIYADAFTNVAWVPTLVPRCVKSKIPLKCLKYEFLSS